jgi:hypothetical protein
LIRDWYGTSRELAAVLMASNRCRGNLNEIVFVEGLRLGNTARVA